MVLTWKDPHRIRLDQIVGECISEYTIWKRKKIEDTIPLPIRMQVSVSDLAPMQPSEVEIVRSEFAFERLEMKQKYLRLLEMADKCKTLDFLKSYMASKMEM